MRRPGSEDPHRRELKFVSVITDNYRWYTYKCLWTPIMWNITKLDNKMSPEIVIAFIRLVFLVYWYKSLDLQVINFVCKEGWIEAIYLYRNVSLRRYRLMKLNISFLFKQKLYFKETFIQMEIYFRTILNEKHNRNQCENHI